MKLLSQRIPLLAVLLMSSSVLRAGDLDLAALAQYADQLRQQGVRGDPFMNLVDQRHQQMMQRGAKPKDKQAALVAAGLAPGKPQGGQGNGIGAFVQQMHAQGLHGQALAAAIHTEQQRRGIGQGHGKPGGPPGQDKSKPSAGAPGQDKNKPNAGNAGVAGKNPPKGSSAGGKGKGGKGK